MLKIKKVFYLLVLSFSIGQIPPFGSDSTFDVVTWNIEWFPKNGQQTVNFVSDIIQSLECDIIAFQEIDEKDTFDLMIEGLPNFSSFSENSMWNDSHGLAYVYRNDLVTINDVYDIYIDEIYHQIFMRSPMVLDIYFENKNYILINNHLKCCGDGILDPSDTDDHEFLRFQAMNYLKDYVDNNFPESRVIILGDLNDDITEPAPHNIFSNFLEDSDNYVFADMNIAMGNSDNWSFPAFHPIVPWPSHLDHIILTNELFDDFDFADVETIRLDDYFDFGWAGYDQNVSDHRPVGIRLSYPFPNDPPFSFNLLSPSDGEIINSTIATLNWESSFDADIQDEVTYFLHIGTSISDVQVIPNDTLTSFQLNDLFQDNSTFFWKVIASDNYSQTENIGGFQSFIINEFNDPPSQVNLIAPLDSSVQLNLNPGFYWTASEDPDPQDDLTYTFQWWEAGDISTVQTIDLDSNGISLSSVLIDNKEYRWLVKTYDLLGADSFSDIGIFFTDAFPEPPSDFSTLVPIYHYQPNSAIIEFSWRPASDPDPLDIVIYKVLYVNTLEEWHDPSAHMFSPNTTNNNILIELENDSQYFWGVIAIDSDGYSINSDSNIPNSLLIENLSTSVNKLVPEVFALHQNYPNPFNPQTIINYDIAEESFVNITIFDMLGREIRNLVNVNQLAGYHSIHWNARNDAGEGVSAGMYIYVMQAGEFRSNKKMILLK